MGDNHIRASKPNHHDIDAPIAAARQLHIGVCGFCLPQAAIFDRFRLLEVQQTFYWPPRLATVERWRRIAPPDFEFTVKAFQAITHPGTSPTYRKARLSGSELAECGHFRDTEVVRSAWQLTASLASALEANVVVFQCPPRFAATDENVKQMLHFFDWAPRGRLRFAWEPRHPTWTDEIICDICRSCDLIHAVDPLEQPSLFGEPKYFRLHGTAKGDFRYDYDHPYSEEELRRIDDACGAGPTYCLFNNIQMAVDAKRFEALPHVSA